jgi:hypothetical protein
MKRNRLFICSIIIISSCVTSVRAEEKFYIPKEEIDNKVKIIAITPIENIILESLNYEYENSPDMFWGLKRLVSYGMFNPKGLQILKEKTFIDSVALVTENKALHKIIESGKYTILDMDIIRQKEEKILSEMGVPNESNPLTTIKGKINKRSYIVNLCDSLEIDAVLNISYQMTLADVRNSYAKWDSYAETVSNSATEKWEGKCYAFSMVATMFGCDGDTLWLGRYGMRVLNGRTTGENIFEKDRIEEAINKIFKKLSKAQKTTGSTRG